MEEQKQAAAPDACGPTSLAYVLGQFPSLTETFILRELDALRRVGLSPRLFVLNRPSPDHPVHADARPWLDRVIYLQHPGHYLARALPLAWRLFPFGSGHGWRNPQIFVRRVRTAASALAFATTGRRFGITRIHAHFLHAPAETGLVLARLIGARFSLSAHAWDVYTPTRAEQAPLVAAAERVFVCSGRAREFLHRRFPDFAGNIELAYHGLPLAEFAAGSATPGHIVAVGRLERKKGFPDLLEALAELMRQGIPVRCTLVGSGSQEQRLRDTCIRLGIADRVTFTGALDQAAVRELVRTAAVFVLPSIVLPDGDRDGLPTVLLEAMACGVPVVTTTANAAAEIIRSGENGFLTAPRAPAEIADILAGLLRNEAERQRIGQAGRASLTECFAADRAVSPLLRLFRSCSPH